MMSLSKWATCGMENKAVRRISMAVVCLLTPLCGACGLLRLVVPARCELLDLSGDANVAPVADGEPPSAARRVLKPGDTWKYNIRSNQSGELWTWASTGRGTYTVSSETAEDAAGTPTKVLSWSERLTDCASGGAFDASVDMYFTQDKYGLVWNHGYHFSNETLSYTSLVADPSRAKFLQNPPELFVGAKHQEQVTYDDGHVERFQAHVIGIDDVATPILRES